MNNKKMIEKLFQLNQAQLLDVMSNFLNAKYKTVTTTKHYIIAIGQDTSMGLVAHLDTVFHSPPQTFFYDQEKNVMWSPDGLGADDRAGVMAIIELVNRGYRPTIILCCDEEKGGLGAQALIQDFSCSPTGLKYLIEIDRAGKNDFVTYDCNNEEFNSYISSFGFEFNWGSFSDISFIAPIWGVAAANVSCGYVDEHSYAEHLYINYLNDTIDKVEQMLLEVDNAPHFKYIPGVEKPWRIV